MGIDARLNLNKTKPVLSNKTSSMDRPSMTSRESVERTSRSSVSRKVEIHTHTPTGQVIVWGRHSRSSTTLVTGESMGEDSAGNAHKEHHEVDLKRLHIGH